MKYLKTFEKMMSNFVLYHGSPYLFSEFKNRITFFSDNPKFAWEYASEKSMDNEMDAEPIVYICKLNGEIFDANNGEHLQKLKNKLPDKVTCYMTNFCFPHDFTKDDILELLKGDDIIEPNPDILTAKIGDEIPDPSYPVDKFIVVRIDDDNVYTIDKKNFNYYLEGASSVSYGNHHFGYEYRKHFKEFIDYVKDVVKNKGVSIYNISDHLTGLFLSRKHQKAYGGFELTDEEYNKGVELFEIGKKDMMEDYSKTVEKPWNKKPKNIKLSNTWRYYENDSVSSSIKALGFSGYVAKEDNHNTYAIFNPKETINIESIRYEGNEFKNMDDINKYNILNNELYKHYKSSLDVDRFDVYKYMKQGLSLEQIIDIIDKLK